MVIVKQKLCKECGVLFTPHKSIQKYCGYKCSNTVTNRKNKKEVSMKCIICGIVFTKRPSDLKLYKSAAKNKYRFCSKKCHNNGMQKTMTIPRLKVRAWNQFSKYIRERDNWTCITCGKVGEGQQIHAGHFISRRYNNTLFDERNVHAQCSGCNMFRNGEPHIYAEKIISRYGMEVFEELLLLSKQPKKFTKEYLVFIYEHYKNINKSYRR